jgi:putative phosphoribosyl transferase
VQPLSVNATFLQKRLSLKDYSKRFGSAPEASLEAVSAPTLLIVGGRDDVVIQLNREAFERLKGAKELQIIPGATHLFEEPGTLDRVAQLARDWFVRHFG